jgi:hypothetical protein
LEYLLGKEFGYQNRTIWEDVQQTYYNTISELGHTSIKIKTNLIPSQKYKFSMEEVEIIN